MTFPYCTRAIGSAAAIPAGIAATIPTNPVAAGAFCRACTPIIGEPHASPIAGSETQVISTTAYRGFNDPTVLGERATKPREIAWRVYADTTGFASSTMRFVPSKSPLESPAFTGQRPSASFEIKASVSIATARALLPKYADEIIGALPERGAITTYQALGITIPTRNYKMGFANQLIEVDESPRVEANLRTRMRTDLGMLRQLPEAVISTLDRAPLTQRWKTLMDGGIGRADAAAIALVEHVLSNASERASAAPTESGRRRFRIAVVATINFIALEINRSVATYQELLEAAAREALAARRVNATPKELAECMASEESTGPAGGLKAAAFFPLSTLDPEFTVERMRSRQFDDELTRLLQQHADKTVPPSQLEAAVGALVSVENARREALRAAKGFRGQRFFVARGDHVLPLDAAPRKIER